MAETVVVNRSYLPSSPNPCFTVRRNGKQAAGVDVRLYAEKSSPQSPYWKSLTKDNGVACVSTLPEGKYEFIAISGRRDAEVDIEVSKKSETSEFQMTLALPYRLQSVVEAPVQLWLQQLRGVVEDPSGAVIPNVKIEVWRKGPSGEVDENPVAKAETNDIGHFTCNVGQGTYIAIFEFPGFALTAFPFEIDRKGWEGLRLTMQIGGTNGGTPTFAELATDHDK